MNWEKIVVPDMERIGSMVVGCDDTLYIAGRGKNLFLRYDLDKNRFRKLEKFPSFKVEDEIYRGLVISRDADKIYVGTSISEEHLRFRQFEYFGGRLFEYDLKKETIRKLGIPVPHEAIKGLTISLNGKYLFGESYPSNLFFRYEIETRKTEIFGPIARKFRQGYRYIVTLTGYVYGFGVGAGLYGKFFKYHPESNHYEIIELRLPEGDECSYFSALDEAVTDSDGRIYCSTYPWGDLIKFHPEKEKEEFEYIGRPSIAGEINRECTPSLHRNPGTNNEGRLSSLSVDNEGRVFGAAGFEKVTFFSYVEKERVFINHGLVFDQSTKDSPAHIQAMAVDKKGNWYLGDGRNPSLFICRTEPTKKTLLRKSSPKEQFVFETKHVWVGSICSICELLLSSDNKVYLGGTCQAGKGGLFAYYDPEKDEITDLRLERHFPLEEKIHRALVEGKNGRIYGGTGYNKDLAGVNFEYPGGHLFSYEPETGEIEDLGIPVKGDLIFSLNIDPAGEYICGGTYPRHHFFCYDIKNKKISDKGMICPYWMFSYKYLIDRDGSFYGVGDGGYFFKYSPAKDRFSFLKARLPDKCFCLDCVVSHPDFGMYFSTHGDNGCNYVFRFDERKEELEYVGKPTRGRTPALGFDKRGCLYMAAGSSKAYLFRYDPKTKETLNLGAIEFTLDKEKMSAYRIHNLQVDQNDTVYLGETDYYRSENTYFYIGRSAEKAG